MWYSIHCSFCYYVHYAMVMSKRNKISFQRYVRDAMKKIVYFRFHHKKYINCYYVHYAAIMTKKFIFKFQHHYIHYTMMITKNYFFPYASCYYVHCAVIMSKKYFFHGYYVHYAVILTKIYVLISALCLLHLDHDKKYTFLISVLRSLGPNHVKIISLLLLRSLH